MASGFTLERQPSWALQFTLLWSVLLGGGQAHRALSSGLYDKCRVLAMEAWMRTAAREATA